MELFILFIIAFIIIAIVMAGRSSGEGKRPGRAFHSGWSSDHNDLASSDPNSITHAQFIYRQAGFGSGDSPSAYDSCAPANTEPAYDQPAYDSCSPGDFGGGNCSDSGGSFDSGGSCSTDSGSGSY